MEKTTIELFKLSDIRQTKSKETKPLPKSIIIKSPDGKDLDIGKLIEEDLPKYLYRYNTHINKPHNKKP
jgi:hypothetical protein